MYDLIDTKKFNVVYGQRNTTKDSLFKKISASVFYFIFNLLSYTKIPGEVSDFKLIDRMTLNVLKEFKEQEPFLRGLISWPGLKQEKIIFDCDIRKKGKTV